MADVKELERHPSSRYSASPLEDNMFEWHFTIRGPVGSDFDGGLYHGRILLPAEYPFKPPNIVFMNQNGRFEVGTKICLSISAHHEETWQPAWGIRTMLEAIISFLPSPGAGAIGALDWSHEERQKLAEESHRFTCPLCGVLTELVAEHVDGEEEVEGDVAAQVAQLTLGAAAAAASPSPSSSRQAEAPAHKAAAAGGGSDATSVPVGGPLQQDQAAVPEKVKAPVVPAERNSETTSGTSSAASSAPTSPRDSSGMDPTSSGSADQRNSSPAPFVRKRRVRGSSTDHDAAGAAAVLGVSESAQVPATPPSAVASTAREETLERVRTISEAYHSPAVTAAIAAADSRGGRLETSGSPAPAPASASAPVPAHVPVVTIPAPVPAAVPPVEAQLVHDVVPAANPRRRAMPPPKPGDFTDTVLSLALTLLSTTAFLLLCVQLVRVVEESERIHQGRMP